MSSGSSSGKARAEEIREAERAYQREQRRKEWEQAVVQEVGQKEFEAARKAMIEEFGEAINPTVEDVLKYRDTRGKRG